MQIRRARMDDALEVSRLHRNTVRAINSQDYPKKNIERWCSLITVNSQRKVHEQKSKVQFVALEQNKIVGFADYQEKEISGVYTHKDYQHQGIGSALLKKIEHHATQNKIKALQLTSTVNAKPFYESQGYQTIKRYTYKNLGIRVYDMRKKL